MPYARARRFYLTPPSVWIFFISVVLAILAVLVTYGHVEICLARPTRSWSC